MKIYEVEISNTKVVEKILRTMPIKFDHMVTTIIESYSTNTITIVESEGSIKSMSVKFWK